MARFSNLMKHHMLLMAALFLVSQVGSPQVDAQEAWRSLFNGHDLDGWKTNVFPDSFRVVKTDGGPAIRAHCTSPNQRSHLFFVDKDDQLVRWKDFELVVVFRGETKSNSGIFFHTDMATRDDRLHLANGYELNLNNSPKEKQKTGSLYAIVGVDDPSIDDTKWTTLRLTVQGKRIVVRINQKVVVDYTEPENVKRPAKRSGRLINPTGGAIAIQAHDPDSVYFFKEIRVRPL